MSSLLPPPPRTYLHVITHSHEHLGTHLKVSYACCPDLSPAVAKGTLLGGTDPIKKILLRTNTLSLRHCSGALTESLSSRHEESSPVSPPQGSEDAPWRSTIILQGGRLGRTHQLPQGTLPVPLQLRSCVRRHKICKSPSVLRSED